MRDAFRCTVILVLTAGLAPFVWGQGTSGHAGYYPYDPSNPYYRPPRKDATYRSAKDYWKAKRQAMESGGSSANSARRIFAGVDYSSSTTGPTTGVAAHDSSARPGGTDERDGPQAITYLDFEQSSCQRLLYKLQDSPWSEDGDTPEAGFSPEGLVRYVFSRIGYDVPKGPAEELWKRFGVQVTTRYGAFAPGDILFFKLFSQSEQSGKLFVAVCLDEQDMVYASFTRKKVIARTYRDRFWQERFVGVKRVFLR